MTTRSKAAQGIAGIAIASTFACAAPSNKDSPVVHMERLLTVCEQTLWKEDSVQGLFKSEMGDLFYPYATKNNETDETGFVMFGGYLRGKPVRFHFNRKEVFDFINGDKPLKAGDKFRMPDLNGDGLIRGEKCNEEGVLRISGDYDAKGDKVNKSLRYESSGQEARFKQIRRY